MDWGARPEKPCPPAGAGRRRSVASLCRREAHERGPTSRVLLTVRSQRIDFQINLIGPGPSVPRALGGLTDSVCGRDRLAKSCLAGAAAGDDRYGAGLVHLARRRHHRPCGPARRAPRGRGRAAPAEHADEPVTEGPQTARSEQVAGSGSCLLRQKARPPLRDGSRHGRSYLRWAGGSVFPADPRLKC